MLSYPLYDTRTVHRLDAIWDCAFLGTDANPESVSLNDIVWTEKMSVPGVFDSCPPFLKKRGLFALRHSVKTHTANTRGRLRVEGMGLWGRVFVDGKALGTCQTPYAPWSVEIPAAGDIRREIIFLIDNRFDPERVPLFDPFFDFFGYGGLYRAVTWHELPTLAIDRVAVTPLDLDGRVRVDLRLDGKCPETIDAVLSFDDGERVSFTGLEVKDHRASLETSVPNTRLWSPDSPALHTLRVEIDGDSITERFGIRRVRAENGKIMLNDQPLKLLGYNRHEAHPQFGPALPPQQLLQDLQTLKKMGCNFVRGSHYPQDQRFLDLCDEMGFVVWEEALGWGTPATHLSNPRFNELQEVQTRAMVRTSINHPSVILWGFLNECASDTPESEAPIARLRRAILEEDDSRLVTFASHKPFTERNYHQVDVISINIYPGWYSMDRNLERPAEEVEPTIDRLLAHFEANGIAHKPFILSEIGAGAIYGCRDELETFWSEQYQARYLDILTKRVTSDDRIAGLSIWQFQDCRTYASGHALGRPRSFNNKGSFDEYRRPKLGAAVVEQNFKAFNS
jgi:beta-glucuronidase